MNKFTFGLCLALTTSTLTSATAQTASTSVTFATDQVKAHFERFAATWIPAAVTATATKPGGWATFAAWNPSTGQAIALSGYGGAATFTVNASGNGGPCFSIGGLGVNENLEAAAGTITYYQAFAAPDEAVPADAAQANALFIKIFGAAALPAGQSLATLRVGPTGKASAFYLKTTAVKDLPNGKIALGCVKAIALVNGKLSAIWAAGTGGVWGKYAQ